MSSSQMSTRYIYESVIGKGTYGTVYDARDKVTNKTVAIKSIAFCQQDEDVMIRTIREMKLLRHIQHPNIIKLENVIVPDNSDAFGKIELVLEKMACDLREAIHANDDFTPDHHKIIMFQLLRGLEYLHSCNVLHRDLKPSNILINTNCKVVIADLGLARINENLNVNADHFIQMSDYVVTRWYRPPELLIRSNIKYDSAIDMWALGCIFAELILRKPLFPGHSSKNQLKHIIMVLGKPPQEFTDNVSNIKVKKWLSSVRPYAPVPFRKIIPNATDDELIVLENLLHFDPAKRWTAKQLLSHRIFSELSSKNHIGSASEKIIKMISSDLLNFQNGRDLRRVIYEEARLMDQNEKHEPKSPCTPDKTSE